ncbi:MAG: serine--tRNA ligase [Candidatus Pacebacteria bacterium]|nr:serine--tRNA ligase [Candidatus Paceibacterota bacterium]
MIDIKKIIENTKEVEQALLKRLDKGSFNLEEIIKLENERKNLTTNLEALQAKRNEFSHKRPDKKTIEEMKELAQKIKDKETQLKQLKLNLFEKVSALPNLPADDVKAGDKENNEVIYTFKAKPELDFKAKDHVELAKELDIIDYERATKMSGNGFWGYKGAGAWLEWSLLNFFMDYHEANNYQMLLLPYLLNEDSAFASGHLPKFRDDLYWTQDKICLNATAEMMLTNYHRDEILFEKDLPKKYFSYATSFRREAGSYRKEERGMIRGHQFNKVEIFQFTKPENSWQAFSDMNEEIKKMMETLDLHFQVSKLAAKDASAAMAKTYDVEVWIPSMNIYKEVSSISNATDYQARRAKIRYKSENTGKNEFLHTLNASGLATSRLIPAILEQNQRADGSVIIPKVLHEYLPEKYQILKSV